MKAQVKSNYVDHIISDEMALLRLGYKKTMAFALGVCS